MMISKEDAIAFVRKDFVSVKTTNAVDYRISSMAGNKPPSTSLPIRTKRTGIVESIDLGTVYNVPSIIKAGYDDDIQSYFYARVIDVFPASNCVVLFECDSSGTPAYIKGKARIFEGYLTAFLHLAERYI